MHEAGIRDSMFPTRVELPAITSPPSTCHQGRGFVTDTVPTQLLAGLQVQAVPGGIVRLPETFMFAVPEAKPRTVADTTCKILKSVV